MFTITATRDNPVIVRTNGPAEIAIFPAKSNNARIAIEAEMDVTINRASVQEAIDREMERGETK